MFVPNDINDLAKLFGGAGQPGHLQREDRVARLGSFYTKGHPFGGLKGG